MLKIVLKIAISSQYNSSIIETDLGVVFDIFIKVGIYYGIAYFTFLLSFSDMN